MEPVQSGFPEAIREMKSKSIVEQITEASHKIEEATVRGPAKVVWMSEDATKFLHGVLLDKENADRAHEIEDFLNRPHKIAQN